VAALHSQFQDAPLREILIPADDLTGALEAGAAFPEQGLPSKVTLLSTEESNTRVLVIDTETRRLPEGEAATRISSLTQMFPSRLVYKKTDLTFRGNIRAELAALSRFRAILYVPAYPQLGRTIQNGCLHVHGVSIEKTHFARDPLHPISHGNIAKMLAGIQNVTICEANTEEEIESAARSWVGKGGSAAGPSCLLAAAAKILSAHSHRIAFPHVSQALIVSGRRHERSMEQLAAAASLLHQWGWAAMKADEEHRGDSVASASDFGRQAAPRLSSKNFDALIVFGGDTAYFILKALAIDSIEPLGEVLPGIPISSLPNGMTLATKAGGFGPPDVLLQLHEKLAHVTT
jgi:uncharacterized protein YgbK (DUF1537 family)